MNRLPLILIAFITALTFLSVTAQTLQTGSRRGGRYDQQIRVEVSRVLRKEAKYKKVKAEVEDSVVTLTGSVELDSTRRGLVDRIRKISHVEAVQNQVLLDPPALDDKLLYSRVTQGLADAGFEALKCTVHEGAVTLEGMVADQMQREHVIDLVRRMDGVKEVDARLSFASK
jgi:osmotically-inducible protein OsmY